MPNAQDNVQSIPTEIYPGVWRFTLGTPEQITPVGTRHYAPSANFLPPVSGCPLTPSGTATDRGYLVSLPLGPCERIYGLGLQLQSFQQRGLKKKLRVNADPEIDSGDSHAPVPFYVTTAGYGVLIDTARYATFYCGNKVRKPEAKSEGAQYFADEAGGLLPAAYRRNEIENDSEVLVEIPQAQGVDVYIFAGPDMLQAVQRYNLFAGGGPLPPRWGLGFWYRCGGNFAQNDVLKMAADLRERDIPCDVLGLEPHWQSNAYSCSFMWNDDFPEPSAMIEQLGTEGYRVNLWEHAFTHPTSPIYEALLPHSGDYEVWGGLVPDFLKPEAREIFAELHEEQHIALGVAGYKMDECDNSDFTDNWSFPELSRFPSGADGEQVHSLLGLRYQDAVQSAFEKRRQRTYGLVRSSQALAAPYPYVLYSDLYDHKQFIRGIAQSSFSGLLWTPEVRHATGPEDLVRRLQTVCFSPLAMVNAWYLKNPPWKQVDTEANNAGDFSPGWEEVEALCREVIGLRMRFIPYLHAAFVRYQRQGVPPFRALVLDYPQDPETYSVDDQYLMGDSLLVAPMVAGQLQRLVYLPQGYWYCFWTGECLSGRQTVTVAPPLGQIPLYVKSSALLPLAEPTLHTGEAASHHLTIHVYGDGSTPCTLYNDDDSWAPGLGEVHLQWDNSAQTGHISPSPYSVLAWSHHS